MVKKLVAQKLKFSQKLDARQSRMKTVLRLLKKEYPDAHCALIFKTPYQLLVATILSAQCTDERVNKVTPHLFEKYPDALAMSKASLPEIEAMIRSTGFFKNKALSISQTSKVLVEQFGGEVPRELETLVQLRGVGRKTANVILGNAYDTPALVVDTHVGRLSRRLGFTKQMDAVKVEFEMMKIVEQKNWTWFSHWLIWHGRKVCGARKPLCDQCVVAAFCPKEIL